MAETHFGNEKPDSGTRTAGVRWQQTRTVAATVRVDNETVIASRSEWCGILSWAGGFSEWKLIQARKGRLILNMTGIPV